MRTRLTLHPHQDGAKQLRERYGERLVCVRYRYDEATKERWKTVELIIEKSVWEPPQSKWPADTLVAVQVAARCGGHDVPRDRIVSRFERSLANLRTAIAFVPTVELYDNSSSETPYRHVATFKSGILQKRMSGRLPNWARGIVPSARSKK